MSDVTLEALGGLHPAAIADIVFVHGLGGDPRETWMVRDKEDTYWPKWIYEDLSNSNTPCSVWALGYPAAPTGYKGDAMELLDRADNVLGYLTGRGIGKRPIIFIAHSLGGLLVKQVLKEGFESTNVANQDLAWRTQAVVFMATPHHGSNLASVLENLRIAMPTAAITTLRAHSPELDKLNKWYQDKVEKLQIRTLVVRENRKMSLSRLLPVPAHWIVDPTSADPNIPGADVIPIDANHLEICKPMGREASVYVYIKPFLTNSLAQIGGRQTDQDRRRFLGRLANGNQECLCVLSSFESSQTKYKTAAGEDRVFEGTTVSPEDTSAAVYLCGLVARVRNLDKLKVRASGTVEDHELEQHLLLVGSSLTNMQTAWALSTTNARFQFALNGNDGFRIECQTCKDKDTGENRKWLPNDGNKALDPQYTEGKATLIDYAVVQRLKWKQFDIFVLAGLGPVGTKGAAYFMHQRWLQLLQTYGDQPFGVVLRFGTKGQPAKFIDPTVVHRTDPDHRDGCTDTPLIEPAYEVANFT